MAPPLFERLSAGRGLVLQELRPEAFDALVPDPYQRDAIVRVGIQSYILVPLRIGDRLLGALGLLISESARRYDEEDLALAEELARRSAVAMENARLYAAERAARGEAEAANRAKMEFLTTMSHELRTPLNAIGGHAQLLQLGIHGPVTDPQQDALGRIQSSQAHLLGLINDVLNFAKLDAGKVEDQIADVPLEPLVASVAALVAPQLAAKAIHYAHACDATPVARADADKVRQILLNLLSNAAKFTPRGGSVTVRCTADALATRVVVADTGVGIAREKLEHIFEPFVQVGRSLSTRHEGTGIGLAISRELARAMGGDLTVQSELDVGSSFTLRLPVARR
jgi:signal transduction histidine kinase